ncbi:MAG: SCO family protein [Cardiobacteriaceae bacterium]|nr:SCO family protein [Cardiobacteriaceae bacterium]
MFARRIFAIVCLTLALCGSPSFARSITFSLQGAEGAVSEQSYPGQYLLLAIGFTACPDICPTTLYEFANVMKSVKNPDAIQPVFVTIDPLNDDVARLNAYTRHFDPRIAGLGGDIADIRALTDQLGATFGYRLNGKRLATPEAGAPYSVYHSALVYLISPERRLVDAFDYRIGARALAQALDKVLGDAPATVAAAPESRGEIPEIACDLPKGFKRAEKAIALKEILPEAAGGKPAVLNLWALWCKPCREELPLLDALAAQTDALAVQTLNLGDDEADIAKLFKELSIEKLPATRSGDDDILDKLGAVGLPFTALFVGGKQIAVKTGVLDEKDSIAAFAQCASQP